MTDQPPTDDDRSRPPVLHVAAVSLPHQDGYAIRTQRIVTTQRASGPYWPIVATSPFYPGEQGSATDAVIDGVEHRRCPHPADVAERSLPARLARFCRARGGAWRWPEQRLLIRRFARMLSGMVQQRAPAVIHAHSPFWCAAAALRARPRRPVVYEVRGFWEESNVAGGLWPAGGWRYRLWRRQETRAMRAADAVICLGEQMKREIIARRVDPQRVFIVPNAVDPALLDPPTGDDPTGLHFDQPVLGYVGSLRPLEGVDTLIRAAATLVKQGRGVRLLIVGDGPQREALQTLARGLGLGDRAVFTGRVPSAQIGWYYRKIDVFAVTRASSPVTRLVTPLKPIEAMATGRAVVASDLSALAEIIQHGQTGLLAPPAEPVALAEAMARLLDDADLRARLGREAQAWVAACRTWPVVLQQLEAIYRTATDRNECPPAKQRTRD